MIHSHLAILLVFAALVSTVFALLLRDDTKSRLRFGLWALCAFVASVIVGAWLMSPFPG